MVAIFLLSCVVGVTALLTRRKLFAILSWLMAIVQTLAFTFALTVFLLAKTRLKNEGTESIIESGLYLGLAGTFCIDLAALLELREFKRNKGLAGY